MDTFTKRNTHSAFFLKGEKKMIEELKPKFSNQKSFYRKAYIETWKNGQISLSSYYQEVAIIEPLPNGEINKILLCPGWDKTRTTIKHVREFMQQYSFAAMTKDEITKKAKKLRKGFLLIEKEN